MKIFQALFFAVVVLIFAGCTSYGKKYSPDKDHEVYYKGADESDAKKLSEYLKTAGYFIDGHQATVQIVKTKDTFNLNFVYDKSQVDAEREAKFIVFGGAISKNVFNSAPVNIHLCDNKLEMFKDVGYAKPAE